MQQQNLLTGTRRMTRRGAMLGAAGVGLFAARGGARAQAARDATPAAGAPADYPEVLITAVDMAFGMPARMAGGWTRVTLRNAGQSDHHATFMRLGEGKTFADFEAAMAEPGFTAMLAISEAIGGPGSIAPGEESSVILDLTPGQYAVICAIPGPDGMPHYLMGMASALEVSEPEEALSEPASDLTVDMFDFGFGHLPTEMAAGPQVWKVDNIGAQLHELVVYRLAEGVAFEQAQAMLSEPPADAPAGAEASPVAAGEPPFVGVAGVAPVASGFANWLVADLEAGDYFAICFIPDPETGAPHFALGMVMPFTVA